MITSEISIAQARLESIKSGLVSAIVVGLVAGTILLSSIFIPWPLPIPSSLLGWLVNLAVAITSGFFFGVTYRYIVRQDDNLHLGGGAVGAFAFVRSLTHIEATWDDTFAFLPWLLITGESFLWFVSARYTLDWVIGQGWIKPTD
ncbi:MAG: hypothetical protein AAFY72_01020 [Cyanobacteria bacterium J06649_4]